MISAFIQRRPRLAHIVFMGDGEVDQFKWDGNRILTEALKQSPQHEDALLSYLFTLNWIEK